MRDGVCDDKAAKTVRYVDDGAILWGFGRGTEAGEFMIEV